LIERRRANAVQKILRLERVLVANLTGTGTEKFEVSELARFLWTLSGLYDQAARAATAL